MLQWCFCCYLIGSALHGGTTVTIKDKNHSQPLLVGPPPAAVPSSSSFTLLPAVAVVHRSRTLPAASMIKEVRHGFGWPDFVSLADLRSSHIAFDGSVTIEGSVCVSPLVIDI